LQAASKIIPTASWSYLRKKFFEPADHSLTEIPELIKGEIAFWLRGVKTISTNEEKQ
jgi:hypothetical protein